MGRLCLKEVPFPGYKVYKRAGISRVEVNESARKSTILVLKELKGQTDAFRAVNNSRKLVIYPYLQDGAFAAVKKVCSVPNLTIAKGGPFVNRGYTKGVPVLSKSVYKRVRG